MAYTNFQHCTANEYKNIIYNQETNNKIKILFNNVELEDADEYCESFEVVSRVIPNGSKIFMLENLVSQEATLILHNIDTSIIQDQVSISIGTLVSENTYEYVPIGIYNLQEIPTTDNGKTTIKLRDNSVKLDFNYNAKPLIDEHGGTATKLQILQDICSQANITCNVSSFIGSSDLIGIYDNTITGRQYVAYLAGSAGAIPIITRSGALDFKYLNNLSIIQIPIEIVEQYSNAENFKISRVVYEDATRKYESGNETYDTLFLDSANPYISSQEQVASIYNIVNNFEINSFTTGRILGNPAIDSYDLIQITDYDGTIFKTFANNTLRYNGKMINTFASEISFERKKENVSLKSGATFKKWAKTEIDNANAQITIQAGQIEEIEQELVNPTSLKEGKYFDLQDALDSPLIDFSLYGNTSQSGTPTPSSPQPIHNVSGDNTIEICGKNLLNITTTLIANRTNNGITTQVNDNQTITISGTASSTARYFTSDDNNKIFLKAGTYTISTNSTIPVRLSTKKISGATKLVADTFTIDEDFYIYNGRFNLTNGTTYNETIWIQLEKGSTATTYEAYQGNSQLISLGVENLFNKDNANILNNVYISANENKLATTTGTKTLYISIKGGKTYTISKTISQRFAVATTEIIPQAQVSLIDKSQNNLASSITIATSSNANYLCVFYLHSSDTKTEQEILDSIQIEKGSKANTYTPYGTTPIELCKIGDYQDYIYKDNNIWYLHKEIGKVVLDGSENWSKSTITSVDRYVLNIPSAERLYLKDINSLCNSFKTTKNVPITQGYWINNGGTQYVFCFAPYDTTTLEDWKTWLGNNNAILYQPLITPTDTEITDTTLLEQLNRLMTLPLYKNMTHITLTPNDLQPTMKIEYYRDTDLNNSFVPKSEMSKYYTKTETIAQIQIGNSSIQQNVAEIQTTLDSNGEAINTISNQVQTLQSSTSLQINAINSQLENGVEKLTNSLVKIDANGINTSKTGETFNTQITNKTFEVKDGTRELAFIGYDNDQKRTVARMDDLESKRATIGVHRAETITKNGKKRTAWFYVGGGN